LSLLDSLNSTEPLIALVEDRINAFQEGVAKNIKGHRASGLNTTVHHTIASIRKAQILLLNSKLGVPNGEGDDWKLVRSCAGREDITL
jgi:hypothetical protein